MSGNHLRFSELTTVIICYGRVHSMRLQSVSGVVCGTWYGTRTPMWRVSRIFKPLCGAQQHEIEKFIFPQGL